MGKVFGILSVIFGMLGLATLWLGLLFPILGMGSIGFAILAIIFGAIGIPKDDSKAPSIIGLIFGILWILNTILYNMVLSAPYI